MVENENLSSLITIVVVTSPIQSNPSTELLDRCLSSIIRTWPQLAECPKVIAADGCRECAPGKNRKRVFGKADAATIHRYHMFLDTLNARPWLTVNRPRPIDELSTEWSGFAITLQKAIEDHVTTPLVFVTPHDYELEDESLVDVTIDRLARVILDSSKERRVNYVGLPNAKTLTFHKRHNIALEGLETILLRGDPAISLIPLGLWKENPHLASVQTYRDFVFGENGLHRFKRGHFIEDTLGQQMLQVLKSTHEDKQSCFNSFGTYLLQSKAPCTHHINGISYVETKERACRGYSLAKDFEIQRSEAAVEFVRRMNEH